MEKADLEAERVALFESVIQNQRSMKEFESNLLHKLSSIQVTNFAFIFQLSNEQSLYVITLLILKKENGVPKNGIVTRYIIDNSVRNKN